MDINDLEKIVKVLEASSVSEFSWEDGDTKLHLERCCAATVTAGSQMIMAAPKVGMISSTSTVAAEPVVDPDLAEVRSPFVGTFYGRPAPDADPYVQVGDHVKPGDKLCIVEAMKLMNEIEADVAGTVEQILLNDGQVVEFGEVLFRIRRG